MIGNRDLSHFIHRDLLSNVVGGLRLLEITESHPRKSVPLRAPNDRLNI